MNMEKWIDEIKMEFTQDTQLLELLARHYGESGVHGDYYVHMEFLLHTLVH